ncbi:MAG: lipopolysaccharide biosynthesis protein [Acidobacteriia bacterium]|nr:lipopolysaccharide biosynthesis protein [Terriglobia bacterium]
MTSSPDRDLAAAISKNTIFGVFSGVTQMGTRLITIPIVIAHLGLSGYGIWSIIMTTAAYMRFGSIGIKSAFQKYVAEATGNGDYETANKLLSTGCAAMLALSIAGLIPIAFFSQVLARAAGVPPEFLKSTAGAISVLALIMVMSNVGAVFEAIVMGGHRIDIARRFTVFFSVAEAVAIIIALHFGYGLLAMASIMGTSEVGFVTCCFLASRRVVPQICVSTKRVTTSVLHELFRFAGSYQLVNILQVLYAAILPVTVLRAFGADYAGIYAITLRLLAPAQILQDSFMLPILSGGSMVYASGATDKMQTLLHKSFKVTLAFAMLPLAFVATFGPKIVFAWTGQSASQFQLALVLVSVGGVFQAISLLGLVLYRVSGRAWLDNIRQVLSIATLFSVALFAHQLGFFGILAGLALAEFIGMVFMWYAIAKTFHAFDVKALLPDSLKLMAATAAIAVQPELILMDEIHAISSNARIVAVFQLAAISMACLLAAVPALLLTRSVTAAEGKTLLGVFLPARRVAATLVTPDAAE